MSDYVWPHGRQPTRLLCPWDSPGKNTGVGCHFLLHFGVLVYIKVMFTLYCSILFCSLAFYQKPICIPQLKTVFLLIKCSLWSEPPTSYKSNIKDYWSQIVIINIITMKRLETLWKLPKCDKETEREKMLLKKQCP